MEMVDAKAVAEYNPTQGGSHIHSMHKNWIGSTELSLDGDIDLFRQLATNLGYIRLRSTHHQPQGKDCKKKYEQACSWHKDFIFLKLIVLKSQIYRFINQAPPFLEA